MNIQSEIANVLEAYLDLPKETIEQLLEKPKFAHLGDMAFPCFTLAKSMRKAPQLIAEEIAEKIESPLIDHVEVVSGYVNIFFHQPIVAAKVMEEILDQKEHYGDFPKDKGVMTIDLSSPNIAKPFSMGHLRSTVIGNALGLIAEKNGYTPIRINHLGDWGTQFGKLIVAYKRWGKEEEVRKNPIKELLKLYVLFHEKAEEDPILNEEGRKWFNYLEQGNEEATKLWKWFRKESLEEFNKIYQLLGISFDSNDGEAFFNDKMDAVVDILKEKQLLVESEGAQVVELEEFPPCLIKKSDGATLYATRDLAAAIYRQENYQFVKSLYVVGNEQTLHFKQLFQVLEKMGYDWAKGMVHIPFGMMLKDGKKMSTRKGKVVLLEEVLQAAIELAEKNIDEKNPSLEKKEEVAKQVGTGAIIFHDLKHYRLTDIEFSLQDMLKFEGETGPYIQYTHARACSLLRKGQFSHPASITSLQWDHVSFPIVKILMDFPTSVEKAIEHYDPSEIAKYVIDLAKAFNKYYAHVQILEENEEKQGRLSLVYAVTLVLKEGLRLLGISAPEAM
ncbi:arginine--tRNA ligase [Cytobacillus oceanisediminis]|uniref:Arginine--tRNA ligase n=1 Tax=Niallia alba TaxID=2729105 RepID=A0A7Y0K895_9BACI|nr:MULTISPECIES: arginine--tRNA ligase [Bacillaceae]MBZ9536230.1 arginine--tRNA ligase [Cytobacillus oceanisediminis]NMO77560.1 arginine--tRNA ligase [Niallia alba]